jgi:hypothetical protein
MQLNPRFAEPSLRELSGILWGGELEHYPRPYQQWKDLVAKDLGELGHHAAE